MKRTTLGPRELKRQFRAARLEGHQPAQANPGRPILRSQCARGVRPCPWVTCRYNLFLDVSTTGGIKFVHGEDADPCAVKTDSCALDVAERGPHNREVIADLLNVTFERVRQIEVRGRGKLADALRQAHGLAHEALDPEG